MIRRGGLYIIGVGLLLLAAGQPRAVAPTTPPTYTLSFVGDILLASSVGRVAAREGASALFTGVRDVLTTDDCTIGNLENAVATTGTPEKDKQFTFRAHPNVLAGLRKGGIDAVSVANNHTMDFGRNALLETLRHLRAAGLPSAGAGTNADAAFAPAMLTVRGKRIALLAASRVLPTTTWYATTRQAGIAQAYQPAALLVAIKAARTRADLVVVYLHWGKERAIMPLMYQRNLARQCIDAGADLVIGSHPHVLQGYEYYDGKLIAYSLGNFVFTDTNKASVILQTTFAGTKLTRVKVIPCRIRAYRPSVIAKAPDRRTALQALQARSFGVRIAEDGTVQAR